MIKVGCCGFACSRSIYFKKFNLVEIQQTFYQPPSSELAEKWKKEAPSHFEFIIKAWQLITHPSSSPTYRRLKEKLADNVKNMFGYFQLNKYTLEAWERTCFIAKKLGCSIILFQSPASFKPEKKYINNLKKFFKKIKDKNFKFVWEPRGTWERKFLEEIAKDLEIFICFDPFKEIPFDQKLLYLRLHGKKGYNYKYNDSELKELKEIIKSLKYKSCYVMFNNVYMFDDALRFKELIS